jgi:hypothetical protein
LDCKKKFLKGGRIIEFYVVEVSPLTLGEWGGELLTFIKLNKPGARVHVCNPSYLGTKIRRITVPDGSMQKSP